MMGPCTENNMVFSVARFWTKLPGVLSFSTVRDGELRPLGTVCNTLEGPGPKIDSKIVLKSVWMIIWPQGLVKWKKTHKTHTTTYKCGEPSDSKIIGWTSPCWCRYLFCLHLHIFFHQKKMAWRTRVIFAYWLSYVPWIKIPKKERIVFQLSVSGPLAVSFMEDS